MLSEINENNLNEKIVEKILFDVPKDDLKKGDFIFVFGSIIHMIERTEKAIELYKQKRAPKIIFSGGLSKNSKIPEAIMMKEYAIAHGVLESDIYTETTSNNTSENVINSLKIMKELNLLTNTLHLLIVTSSGHIKRCMLTLSKYMPREISYSYCPPENSISNLKNWKKDKITYERMFREAKNIITYIKKDLIEDTMIDLLKIHP